MSKKRLPNGLLHRPEAHSDAELIHGLEPDQLVATSSVPFPRRRLSRTWDRAFWALRVFVLLIAALVVYTFIYDLLKGP